jgi:hypothetical protein
VGVLTVIVLLGAYFVMKTNTATPAGEPLTIPLSRIDSTDQKPLAANQEKKRSDSSQRPDRAPAAVSQVPEPRRESVALTPDSGSVRLAGTAGAKVHVDSVFVGELPLPDPVRLAAGPHTVVFSHALFEPVVRLIRIAPGKELTVSADLVANAAYLRCTSVPWAEISIDDQYRDTTPMDKPIIVNAGKHRVRFHHPAFRDSVWDVTVAPRETLRVSVTFKP